MGFPSGSFLFLSHLEHFELPTCAFVRGMADCCFPGNGACYACVFARFAEPGVGRLSGGPVVRRVGPQVLHPCGVGAAVHPTVRLDGRDLRPAAAQPPRALLPSPRSRTAREAVAANPSLTLDGLRATLGATCDLTTIGNALRALKISFKKNARRRRATAARRRRRPRRIPHAPARRPRPEPLRFPRRNLGQNQQNPYAPT